jgi:hypothetical protein
MIEKIGSVKNPLTIIAIFAGIAEVSGTTVLPFITPQNQGIFIYFLIIFPTILIILFFVTLNFNNKALYAPSDFSNEENYIKIFRYDISKQENIELTITTESLLKKLNKELLDYKESNNEKMLLIENELKVYKQKELAVGNDEAEDPVVDFNEYGIVTISRFSNAHKLKQAIQKLGYEAKIYEQFRDDEGFSTFDAHKAIWLGQYVSLKQALEVIATSKRIYPHLVYVELSNEDSGAPEYVHYSTFIGGATSTAKERGLKPLSSKDFNTLQEFTDLETLHEFLHSFR